MAEERQLSKISVHNIEAGNNFKANYDELLKDAGPISFPLVELPFEKNTRFTGREEQLTLINNYLSQQHTLAITNSINPALAQAIAGLGGVGKSQLAIEYAYRAYEKKSYQIIWFMNGQNLDVDYLYLATQLKVRGENKDDIIQKTKRQLENLGNYLLIIDDAENYEAIKNHLPQTANNGHVLITTRHRLDWQSPPLELGVFNLDEALEYFKKVTNFKEEERSDVVKLVDQLLGLLPLALTQAGAFIKQTDVSIKKYINFFETQLKELWGTEDKVRDYSDIIHITWCVTLNKIQKKYPKAQEILRGMSYLAPTGIQKKWLLPFAEEELNCLATLGELNAYSMITCQINGYAVHQLVQEVTFYQLPIKEHKKYFSLIFQVLKNEYPYQEIAQIEDFAIQKKLIPHLEALLVRTDKIINNFVKVEKPKLEDCPEEITIGHFSTLILLANAYNHLGDALKKKALLERARVIEEKHYELDHPALAQTLMNLGNAYFALGNSLSSQKLLERVLFVFEKYYGSDHSSVAAVLTNLGQTHNALGNLSQAKELLKRALVIFEKHHGLDHPDVATTLMNLSNTYLALKNVSKQKNLITRALSIFKKHYGSDHPDVAKALMNLGIANFVLGNALESKELLERALVVFEKHYGPDHPEVGMVLTSLGSAYGALGNIQEKKILLERALLIKEKYYGINHPAVAMTLMNLGNVYFALDENLTEENFSEDIQITIENHVIQENNLIKAYDLIKKAHDIFLNHSQCGSEHPHTITAKQNLEIIEEYLSLLEPEQSLSEMIENFENYLIENSEDTDIRNRTAEMYYRQGNVDAVIFHYEIVMKLEPNNADIQHNLSCMYAAQGRFVEAKISFEKAVLIKPTASAYADYGICLMNAQEINLAIVMFQKAITLQQDEADLMYGEIEKKLLDEYLNQEIQPEKLLEISSQYMAYYSLVRCYQYVKNNSELDQTLIKFNNLIEKNPNALGYRLLGYAFQLLDDESRAQDNFVKAKLFDPPVEVIASTKSISESSAPSSDAEFFQVPFFALENQRQIQNGQAQLEQKKENITDKVSEDENYADDDQNRSVDKSQSFKF